MSGGYEVQNLPADSSHHQDDIIFLGSGIPT